MPAARTTFTKKTKERARQERQAEKAQSKVQRKAQKTELSDRLQKDLAIKYDENGAPIGFDFHDF